MPYSTAPGNNTNHFYRLRPYNTKDSFVGLKDSLKTEAFYGDDSELWGLEDNKLYNVAAIGNKFLGGGSSAALKSRNDAHEITFEDVFGMTNVYYIKATISGGIKYLSYSGGLKWDASVSDSCYWVFERLIKFADDAMTAPGKCDYFSEKCGNTDGGPIPYGWKDGLRTLYRTVYSNDYRVVVPEGEAEVAAPTDPTDDKIVYNLYGARYVHGVGEKYEGKFHTGVDIYNSNTNNDYKGGVPIFCPFEGVLVGKDEEYGALAIRKRYSDEIYVFMHMKETYIDLKVDFDTIPDAKKEITAGKLIGLQSNTGLGGDESYNMHLHVEILTDLYSGGKTITTLPTASYQEIGNSTVPYASFRELPYVNPHDNPPTGNDGDDTTLELLVAGLLTTCGLKFSSTQQAQSAAASAIKNMPPNLYNGLSSAITASAAGGIRGYLALEDEISRLVSVERGLYMAFKEWAVAFFGLTDQTVADGAIGTLELIDASGESLMMPIYENGTLTVDSSLPWFDFTYGDVFYYMEIVQDPWIDSGYTNDRRIIQSLSGGENKIQLNAPCDVFFGVRMAFEYDLRGNNVNLVIYHKMFRDIYFYYIALSLSELDVIDISADAYAYTPPEDVAILDVVIPRNPDYLVGAGVSDIIANYDGQSHYPDIPIDCDHHESLEHVQNQLNDIYADLGKYISALNDTLGDVGKVIKSLQDIM